MSAHSCTVYMVRHGERVDETIAGVVWRKQNAARWFDPPLTVEGQKQANHAARGLYAHCLKNGGKIPFTKIYCSPLLRCLMSAEQFGIVFNLPVVPVPGIASCTAAYKKHGRAQSYLPHQDAMKHVPACLVEPFQHDHYQEYNQALVRLAITNRNLLVVTHREGLRDTSILCKQPFQNTPYCCTAVFSHSIVEGPQRCFRKPQLMSCWTVLASPTTFQKTLDQIHPRRLVEDKNAAGEEITTEPARVVHSVSAAVLHHNRGSSCEFNPETSVSHHPSTSLTTVVQGQHSEHHEKRRASFTHTRDELSVPEHSMRPSFRTHERQHFRSITGGDVLISVDQERDSIASQPRKSEQGELAW